MSMNFMRKSTPIVGDKSSNLRTGTCQSRILFFFFYICSEVKASSMTAVEFVEADKHTCLV